MSEPKKIPVPVWYKNTYFWIAALLLILGVIGIISGDAAIRDPGQKIESGLPFLYFVAAIVMLLGGIVSHKQTLQQFKEDTVQKA